MVLKERIERIQRKLGVDPDTVSALECPIEIVPPAGDLMEVPSTAANTLALSRTGVSTRGRRDQQRGLLR